MLEEAVRTSPSPSFQSQLDNPTEFPKALEYLWVWFLEMSSTGRIYEGGGALPLSSLELWAWCQLNDIRLSPWERRCIRLLDVAWLCAFNRHSDG